MRRKINPAHFPPSIRFFLRVSSPISPAGGEFDPREAPDMVDVVLHQFYFFFKLISTCTCATFTSACVSCVNTNYF